MLIVEDGTGLINADSYDSIDNADAYANAFGREEFVALGSQLKEIRLRVATQALDVLYDYPGRPLVREQSLVFPRLTLVVGGEQVFGVPADVRKAMLDMATYPGLPSLLPDDTSSNLIEESKQLDGLRKSQKFSGTGKKSKRHFWVAERLMAKYTEGSISSGIAFGNLFAC